MRNEIIDAKERKKRRSHPRRCAGLNADLKQYTSGLPLLASPSSEPPRISGRRPPVYIMPKSPPVRGRDDTNYLPNYLLLYTQRAANLLSTTDKQT